MNSVRLFAALLALLLSACNSDYSGDVGGNSAGSDGHQYNPANPEGKRLYDQMCASCHGVNGNGSSAGSSLVGCATCTSVGVLADEIARTMPIANVDACIDDCATNTAEYILFAFNGRSSSQLASEIADADNESAIATLRRATLTLAGRLPSAQEEAHVAQRGDSGIGDILDAVMQEEAFYQRLMELFNEQFLTDKYLSRNLNEGGVNLLDSDDYPNRKWYNDRYAGDDNKDLRNCVRNITNDAVAREGLQLIRHAAQNKLPHTLFVNADYMMVNWYSQQVYDAEVIGRADFRQLPEPVCEGNGQAVHFDPTDFRPARIVNPTEYEIGGIPHAGILTSAMFLNRYPTTQTNRNRHRAYKVFDYFLDTDILRIEGERPGDGIGEEKANPTLLDPACYACHQVMDPVSSAFQHWTDRGRYIVTGNSSRNRWDSSDIEPAGLGGKTLPLSGADGYFRNMLQWLGQEIANDPRFVRATVRTLYKGLIGQEPLRTPNDGASSTDIAAFNEQRAVLNQIGQAMVSDGWRIKTAVKGIILSPYFRASSSAAPERHKQLGAQQFLSPEQLQRKLNTTLGFGWDELRHENNRIMLGGMDSDSVIERIREPSGLMIAIQQRMATEMACRATALDFTRSQRLLFPQAQLGDDGSDDASRQRIIDTLKHLHWRLLGEQLQDNSEELQASLALYQQIQSNGQALLADAEQYDPKPSSWLQWECRGRWQWQPDGRRGEELSEEQRLEKDDSYSLHAWQAVLTYLLSDYRFIYE
ncbi:hypothetical protein CHH28_12375 [Bacterioplanes sanyensis]|uniref:Cytochrome c domain-containing protein n=1 Tax=Bacterioplanes sanyensis TaxID=1249553 RepID=A0A222FM06_9GAMM|nr:c-type cytochrome [Bacterioplanes sanyensis]ASP39421.1 hypothetical protein CHH28_12375 [Bacterioplanes sanyensis]